MAVQQRDYLASIERSTFYYDQVLDLNPYWKIYFDKFQGDRGFMRE